jgi:hypothetical protein
MKNQIVKFSDLPKMKQMEIRAMLERNKPKTRIKTKQQSQLKKISKNDYQNWFLNSLN